MEKDLFMTVSQIYAVLLKAYDEHWPDFLDYVREETPVYTKWDTFDEALGMLQEDLLNK